MSPLGILLTSICAVLVMALPRRWALLGVFGGVCYITQGQILNLGGIHLHAIRLVILAGFIRVMVRGELKKLKFNSIDKCIIVYAVYSEVLEGIRLGVWQEQVGIVYDILLSYFVFRCLITSWQDVRELMPKLALLIIPMAFCMILELQSGRSVFMIMGGVFSDSDRDGRFRCVGPFRAPQTAGTFGATLIPLFVGSFFASVQHRRVAVAGLIAATVITYTSNSGGPLMAYLSGVVALAFWPMRKNMQKVRRGIVVFLIIMGLCMKAPIWYILAKIADLTGGDGWYRSYLMEQCYKHFSDWWLMGTDQTQHWAVTLLKTGGADLCNMYVACAAAAGLGSLILFVMLLVKCFQKLGLALKASRENLPGAEGFLWCIAGVLFAHVVNFFSVTYWDQMAEVWWGFLGLLASATSGVLAQPTPVEEIEVSSETHTEADGA